MSRSTTTTPLRAIPSALTNKASLSIPSPTQTYEPLVKSILRQRLTSGILLLSAAFCWLETIIWSIWGLGGVGKLGLAQIFLLPIKPWLLAVVFAHWLSVAVPVVVLRKTYLTCTFSKTLIIFSYSFIRFVASRTNTSSPSQTWHSAWTKTSTRRAMLVYCASSILATTLHVFLAYMTETSTGMRSDPRLTIFVKSKYVV